MGASWVLKQLAHNLHHQLGAWEVLVNASQKAALNVVPPCIWHPRVHTAQRHTKDARWLVRALV